MINRIMYVNVYSIISRKVTKEDRKSLFYKKKLHFVKMRFAYRAL